MSNLGSIEISQARISELYQGKAMGLLSQTLSENAQLQAMNEALQAKCQELASQVENLLRVSVPTGPPPQDVPGS